MLRRARWMERDRTHLVPDVEPRKQRVVRPRNRVDDLELLVPRAICRLERCWYVGEQPVGARRGVDDDRKAAAVAPAQQGSRCAPRHQALTTLVSLGAPGR